MDEIFPWWDELTDSAKTGLRDLAELYRDRGDYTVRIIISEGGTRDFKAETDPAQLRKIRNGKS